MPSESTSLDGRVTLWRCPECSSVRFDGRTNCICPWKRGDPRRTVKREPVDYVPAAPSPSGAEEAAAAIRWARAVCVDHGSAEIADALREYCAWAWAAPSAGARKPGGQA